MSKIRTSLHSSLDLLKVLNYEMHLLQHGFGVYIEKHPWLGMLPAVVGLLVIWTVYWVSYPLLLVLIVLTGCVHPLERFIRRKLSKN